MYLPEQAGGPVRATRLRIRLLGVAAILCAVAAIAVLPRAIEAELALAVQDDPVALADNELSRRFNADAAAREIESALAANDTDLARSFIELAQERGVAVSPDLAARVEAAEKKEATVASRASRFAHGLIVGEPDDMVSLAGTALGDLFVFGDIRDALREGTRLAKGEEADKLILGLAGVGIVITAGTYASLGTGAPARVGLSLAKVARKTGRLGARLGEYIENSLRRAVDWSALRRALATASVTEPAVAVRAVREAVKVEKAEDLLRLTRDVGRVQTRAGTRAAFDSLKIADNPREMARVAKLAEKNGSKTRAVLKFLGRGAIALSVAAFDLALWILWAALTIFGFVASTKGAVERMTCGTCNERRSAACETGTSKISAAWQWPARRSRNRASIHARMAGRVPAIYLSGPTFKQCRASAMATSRSPISTKAKASRSCWCTASPRTKRGQLGHPGWMSALTARRTPRHRARQSRAWAIRPNCMTPRDYHSAEMAEDVRALLDHLSIDRADVMGYSMGARITAFFGVDASRPHALDHSRRARLQADRWRGLAGIDRAMRLRRPRSPTFPTTRAACSARSPSRRSPTCARSPPASAVRARP